MHRCGLAFLCVIAYCLPASAQTPEQKKATLDYVRKLRLPDGGFAASADAQEKGQASLRATSLALRVFKYFGGEVPDKAAAATFVARCFDKNSGTFADAPAGKSDVAVNAIGVMAVVELKMPLGEYEPGVLKYLTTQAKNFEEIRIAAAGLEALQKRPSQADDWLKQLAAMRNKDGTYGEGDGLARATGGAAACWLRLGGKLEHPEVVLAALKKGQRADGGFGREKTDTSDLDTSYRVLRAFHMLKAKPDAEKLRGFIARCRNSDGGYGVAPGQPSSLSATYFAAIILHWLE